MPYRFETQKIKLPRHADKRVKLTEKERADIRARYRDGEDIRAIARVYAAKCSRRLIQIVLFPERGMLIAKQYKERDQAKRSYMKVRGKKWAAIMREHRRYKQKILS